MSSLRIQGQWSTQTSTSVNALSAQAAGWLSFWYRPNAATAGAVNVLQIPALFANVIQVYTTGATPTGIQLFAHGASATNTISVTPPAGLPQHFLLNWNASGNQDWYVNGVLANRITTGGNLATAAGGLLLGTDGAGDDYLLADLAYRDGAILSSADITGLANRSLDPSTVSAPATHWWTLGGTGSVDPTAGGFLDRIGGTVHFTAPSGGGTASYSPDTLNIINPMGVLDAYIDRTGKLFYAFPGRTYLNFRMSGNSGQYTCRVASIRVTAGGSRYTSNPTATITGGNPTRAAVLGTPIVGSGAIVGLPIIDGGDGYVSTDSLSVVITDSTGSGATFAITLGGYPLAVTAISGQPTISANGSAATLNSTTFWTSASQDVPWACYQLQSAASPGDAITWSAPAGFLTTAAGPVLAVAANTPAANYTGVVEPDFRLPTSGATMLVGANAGSVLGLTPNPYHLQANRLKTSGWQSGTLAADGRLISWTGASTFARVVIGGSNATDPADGNNPGFPYLNGPTLVPQGGGSGAVLVPVIAGGVIQQIFVKAGGSSYPSSGAVTINHGFGKGATATYTASGGVIQSVAVTAGGKGYSDGIWKLGYDDVAPGATATVATLSDTSNNYDFVDLAGLPSPLGDRVSAGTNGVGIRKAYYAALKAAATHWEAFVQIDVSGGTVSGSTHTNGMTNEIVAPPNCKLAQAQGVAPDPNYLSWCNFGSGRYMGALRFMDSTSTFGGNTNVVRYRQFPQPTDWAWRNLGTRSTTSDPTQRGTCTFQVSGIRPYDLAVSPKVYINSSGWPTFVADGTVAAYSCTPASRAWARYGPGWWAAEYVTTAPHGLETGQFPTLTDLFNAPSANPAPGAFMIQNGQSGGVAAAPATIGIGGYAVQVFVTGASSFLVGLGGAGAGTGIPDVLSAYCTQDTTRNSVSYVPVLTAGAGYTGQPAIAIDPPTGGWLTARARATTTGGVVQNSIVIDSGGNNYATTPNARIVAPSGSGAVLSVTMSGGAVTGISVTGGGSGYPQYVGVQIDPPGVTATASPTVSGGQVTGLGVVSGGAGYTGGAPEVIVTGDGVGAKFTAVLTGTTVSGFTRVSGGSGYTQANTSVAIAPPPSQATAYITSISGGALQVFDLPSLTYGSAVLIGGGFGYGSTAPSVATTGGGATMQGTAQAVMCYPFNCQIFAPDDGTIPPEAGAAAVAAIPGCAGWWNVPTQMLDADVRSYARMVLANVPRGRKHYVELGNELWNAGFKSDFTLSMLGHLGGTDWQLPAIARAAAVHALWLDEFTRAGRPGEVVCVYGSQLGNNAIIDLIVSYANAHATRVDAVAIAPYIDRPVNYYTNTQDPAFVTAAASVGSALSISTQHGTSWPWDLAMYHSLWDHWVLYSQSYNGTGQGGQPLGYIPGAVASLANYHVPGYSTPQLVGYEGGIELPIPTGVGTSGNDGFLADGLTHDFFFHPAMATSVQVYHLMCLRGGMAAHCYFMLPNVISGQTTWTLVTNAGMPAGAGDGSDGLAANQYWLTDQKSHFLDNVSPALAGLQQAGAIMNPLPPSTPTTTGRRGLRWFPGLRRVPARA
jgi:hypothetical protein